MLAYKNFAIIRRYANKAVKLLPTNKFYFIAPINRIELLSLYYFKAVAKHRNVKKGESK